jgi:hypothetical protein
LSCSAICARYSHELNVHIVCSKVRVVFVSLVRLLTAHEIPDACTRWHVMHTSSGIYWYNFVNLRNTRLMEICFSEVLEVRSVCPLNFSFRL